MNIHLKNMENIISGIMIYVVGVVIITMLNKYVTKINYIRNNIITIAVWSIFTLFIYLSNNYIVDLIIILMIIVTFIFLVRDKSESELNILLKKIKTILKYIGLTCLIINILVNRLYLSSINKVYNEIIHKTDTCHKQSCSKASIEDDNKVFGNKFKLS